MIGLTDAMIKNIRTKRGVRKHHCYVTSRNYKTM